VPRSIVDDNIAIEVMGRYYRWKRDLVAPFLGPRVLEVGCGTGFMMEQIRGRDLLVGVDWDPACVEVARRRFAGAPGIEVRQVDVLTPEFSGMSELALTTVLFANSLEMTGNPGLALRNTAAALRPGGRVVAIVSAIPSLPGALARAYPQCRGSRAESEGLLRDGGFRPLRLKYANLVGAIAWWWDSRVMKRRVVRRPDYRIRDLTVPFCRLVDLVTGPPLGRSLLAVGEKK